VFSVDERDRVRDAVIGMARSDERVIAGAEVGSLTQSTGDRWSDLDLTFGLAEGARVEDVLRDWTEWAVSGHGAVHLFDLQSMSTTYRVLLFPGNLQVDVSVTPGAVARTGPKVEMLFGSAVRDDRHSPPVPRDVFGLAVHHALRARFGIERGRLWSAQHYIADLRRETLSLACLQRGLPARYARGFDQLPDDVLDAAAASLVRSLEPTELLRALRAGIALLKQEGSGQEDYERIVPLLDELAGDMG